MGLFSSKYKRIVGVTVVDLGVSKFDEYADFKRNAMVATDGHIDLYAKALFDYKQKIRHSYSSARIHNFGMDPVDTTGSASFSKEVSESEKHVKFPASYYGSKPAASILPREPYDDGCGAVPWEEEVCRFLIQNQSNLDSKDFKLNNSTEDANGVMNYSYVERTQTDARYGFVIRIDGFTKYGEESIDGKVDATIMYLWRTAKTKHYWEWKCNGDAESTRVYNENDVPDDPCPGESSNISQGEEFIEWEQHNPVYIRADVDIRSLSHSRLGLMNTGCSETNGFLYVGYDQQVVKDNIVVKNLSYKSAPLLSIKELNEGKIVEADNNSTQEERDKAFYQRKLFESFGQNVDNLSTYVENGDIDDMKIGMMIDMATTGSSNAISKIAFDTIDSMIGDLELVPQTNRTTCGDGRISLTTDYGNGVLTSSFNASKKTGKSNSKYKNRRKYRVSALSDDSNLIKNIDKMREVYDTYYGTDGLADDDAPSDGKEGMAMRTEIYQEYNTTASPSEKLKTAYSDLPTIKDLIDIRDRKHLMIEYPYNSNLQTVVSNMNADDSIDALDGYTVNIALPNSTDSETQYSVEISKKNIFGSSFGGGEYIVYSVSKTEPDGNYVEYELFGNEMKYVVDGDTFHKYPSRIEDAGMCIPVPENVMNGLPFYDFMSAYDVLMNGLAFSVKEIEIKWYQQEWFAVVFIIITIIVAVVITVMTAGAGSSIGMMLVDFAVNMAIAYAVTQAVMYVGEKLGVDPMILDIVAFVSSAIATGGVSALSQPSFYLQLVDMYLKSQLREQKEIAEKIKEDTEEFRKDVDEKSKLMTFESQIIEQWAILEGINTRSFYDSLGSNAISMSEEAITSAEEKKKYTLTPVVPMMTDGTRFALSQVELSASTYDPSGSIGRMDKFGDTTYD